jgi:hypothetical protein
LIVSITGYYGADPDLDCPGLDFAVSGGRGLCPGGTKPTELGKHEQVASSAGSAYHLPVESGALSVCEEGSDDETISTSRCPDVPCFWRRSNTSNRGTVFLEPDHCSDCVNALPPRSVPGSWLHTSDFTVTVFRGRHTDRRRSWSHI